MTELPVNNIITDLLDGMVARGAKSLILTAGEEPVYKVGEQRVPCHQYPVLDYAEMESELEALNIVDKKIRRYEMFNYISDDPRLSRILRVFVTDREPDLVVSFREID